MTTYVTFDSDTGFLNEDAFCRHFSSREEAENFAIEEAARLWGDEIDRPLRIVDLSESDCWTKVPRNWAEEGQLGEQAIHYCRELGVDPDDVTVRMSHPGGSHQVWLSIFPEVITAYPRET